ncbi:MAG: hypothetical protein A2X45_13390 [Lentisphaerae bacterium GWF2_50_93]|nr:MAG: hypothetical protein A2X45_13390 [Lentisphaerae bacterium GWF2_50_93]
MMHRTEILNQPRQHHTVSATYLELFQAPGTDKVHVLDLEKDELRFQKPDNILTRRDYYRQEHSPEGTDEFRFEKFMGTHFEPHLKRIIDKLICGGHGITEDEIILFTQFLELQRLKVPAQETFAKELLRQGIELVALGIPEVAEGIVKNKFKVVVKDSFRFTFMHEMLKEQKHFWYFTRMIWNVWTMPDGIHLVTTDNPVAIYNPGYPELKQPGIGRLGSVVLFPLTPRYCLEMVHPEQESVKELDPTAIVNVEPNDAPIHVRAGRVMSEDKAHVVNLILATHADRIVVSDYKPTLERLLSFIRSMEPRKS